MNIQELSGPELDYWVAKINGINARIVTWTNGSRSCFDDDAGGDYCPSSDWAVGGPIIEREKIISAIRPDGRWQAWIPFSDVSAYSGDRLLIAAMRCYVAAKTA